MTRKMTLTFASVLTLAMAAGAVQAQAPTPAEGRFAGPSFEALDFDKDGKITASDFTAASAARQKAMDPNGDGVFTLDEMKAFAGEQAKARAEAKAERRFKMLDTDGDGRVTAAEALAGRDHGRGKGPHGFGKGARGPHSPERMIAFADKDKDGAVSPEEFEAAKREMHERMADRKGPRGDKGRGHGPAGHPHHPKGDAPKP